MPGGLFGPGERERRSVLRGLDALGRRFRFERLDEVEELDDTDYFDPSCTSRWTSGSVLGA